MTKHAQIRAIVEGTHVMGEDGLRDYHKIEEVKQALRLHNFVERFQAVKRALSPYRVSVTVVYGESTEQNKIRIFCPETHAEILL